VTITKKPRRIAGKYNATRIITLRCSAKQHERLAEEARTAKISINELLLKRLFPEGDELNDDHLPPLAGQPLEQPAAT
jgi:hypothetical protein